MSVGIAINVGIGTGNYLISRVTWAGCPLAQYVHNQEIHLCSLVCLLSEQCMALLPQNGTQGNQILTIFLLEADSVGFLFRALVYTPVKDRAQFEATYTEKTSWLF